MKLKILALFIFSILSSACFTSCSDSAKETLEEEKELTNEDWKYAYAENFVDSMDAVFCHKGYTAVYGLKKLEGYPDTIKGERVVEIIKTNFETGEVNADSSIIIVADSTNFPIQIAGKETNILLSRVDETHFDFAAYNFETEEWEEYNNVEFEPMQQHKVPMRSLATGGYSYEFLINVLEMIISVHNIKDAFGKSLIKLQLDNTYDVVSTIIGSPEFDLFKSLGTAAVEVSDRIVKKLSIYGIIPEVLADVAKYAIQKRAQFAEKALGKVRISIENVKQVDARSCQVDYMVEGLNKNGIENSHFDVFLQGRNNGNRFFDERLESKNGYGSIVIPYLPTDRYDAWLELRSTKYPSVGYKTEPRVTIYMFDLGIKDYTVKLSNYNNDSSMYLSSYRDDSVYFNIDLNLSGDEESLKNVMQYGYYVRYSNATEYHPLKNLSAVNFNLPIHKYGFHKNYTTFEAHAMGDYYIGTYVVLKNGNIVETSESALTGLIYNVKPRVFFTSAGIIGTETLEKNEEDNKIKYKTYYQFENKVEGSFWIKNIHKKFSNPSIQNYWTDEMVEDYWYVCPDNLIYTNSCTTYLYYSIKLNNGTSLYSENSLFFTASGGKASISVTNSRSKSFTNKMKSVGAAMISSNSGGLIKIEKKAISK